MFVRLSYSVVNLKSLDLIDLQQSQIQVMGEMYTISDEDLDLLISALSRTNKIITTDEIKTDEIKGVFYL